MSEEIESKKGSYQGSAESKSFSWSQVVREETKTKPVVPGESAPTTAKEAPLPTYAKEAVKTNSQAPANAVEAKAALAVNEAFEVAEEVNEKLVMEKEDSSVSSGKAESSTSEEKMVEAIHAPKPLKPAWGMASSVEVGSESTAAEVPAVLSTSSTSWPTLGDSKTEPQKRGTHVFDIDSVYQQTSVNGGQSGNRGRGGRDVGSIKGNDGNAVGSYRHGNRNNNHSGVGSSSAVGNNRRGRSRGEFNNQGNRTGGQQGMGANGMWNYKGRGRHNNMSRGGGGQYRGNNMGNQQVQPYYVPVFYGPPPVMPQGGLMPFVHAGMQSNDGNNINAQGSGAAAAQKNRVLEAVRVQVEYYFSVQNLCKDMFLRSKMDDDGWIPIPIIANFNRVRALAPDPAMLAEALLDSTLIEVSSNRESIRARENWQTWTLPAEKRDAVQRPQPSPGSPVQPAQPVMNNSVLASMYPCTEVPNEMLANLVLVIRLASRDASKDSSALMITTEIAAMVNNGIAVLESQMRNNAKDQLSEVPMVTNHFYPITPMLMPPAKDNANAIPLVAPSTFGSHIGWMFVPASSLNENANKQHADGTNDQTPDAEDKDHLSVKHTVIGEFGHPAYAYFMENNYVQITYESLKECCYEQRKKAGPSNCPEMYMLYQFWGLFLRDIYNQSMYDDFKTLALQDHEKGWSFGISCLFSLYHSRLLKEFRPTLFKDFEALVKQEYSKGNQQVMHDFKAFCASTGLLKTMNGHSEDIDNNSEDK